MPNVFSNISTGGKTMNARFIRRIPFSLLFAVPLLFAMLGFGSTAVAATEEQIEASIDNGIAWLVDQQNADGSWTPYGTATTCFALIKLQDYAYEKGYDSPFDPAYAYHQNVIDGWTFVLADPWLLKQEPLAPQTAGDPDVNGNGYGLYFRYDSYHFNYPTGICLMALAATGTPDRPNDGGLDFDGSGEADTYGELAQDTMEYLAWAQTDAAAGSGRGGWYYNYSLNYASDNSHTGYVVLGLAAAENFGIATPLWVKDELDYWIDYIQNDVTGGSGYTDPNSWVNVLKTGNLLFEMTFVGDPCTSDRFQAALGYIEDHWRDSSLDPGWGYGLTNAHYQAMFALMKGLEYSGVDLIDTDGDGDRDDDWFNQEPTLTPSDDFASVLVAQQYGDGSWPGDSWAGNPLSSIWALMTLEKIAPQSGPFEVTVDKDYRYTSFCFEKDNDGDGLFAEDPEDYDALGDPIDNDGDGLFNEDGFDCSSSDSYLLPVTGVDPEAYTVEAVIKKTGVVTSYNPGQYYAVSTVEVCRHDAEIDTVTLTFEEDFAQCTVADYPLSALNPKTGGGSVLIAEVVDGMNYQIHDASSVAVMIEYDGEQEARAYASFDYTFAPDQQTATLLMLVKFGPGLKDLVFDDAPATLCENVNRAVLDVYDDPEADPVFTTSGEATAWLKVVPK
jgi:hypothetical protein